MKPDLLFGQVIAHELSSTLVSSRLANVYDLSSVSSLCTAQNHWLTVHNQRIFLFKFAKPDLRQQMLVESGFRCHLTTFTRTIATAPSPFVARLRKYLRTRRVTSISQVGTDRILEFQFSDGQYRLFLEFYAGGNIVLADRDLSILSLLRMVPEGPDQEELRVGLNYSLENRQNYGGVPTLTTERVRDAIQKALDKGENDPAVNGKRSRKKQGDMVRKAVSASLNGLPPMLVDHTMRLHNFSADLTLEEVLSDRPTFDRLMYILAEAQGITRSITSSHIPKGFIIAKLPKTAARSAEMDGNTTRGNLVYEDFHPFRPRQFEGDPTTHILEFDGFNKTVDEFFSSMESQKLESKLNEREENARRKLDTARQDHEKRLGGLQQAQELNVRKAEAIEANLHKVQEATAAINGLIAQGMDWVEIARLIEVEQAKGNPVADIIRLPLKLYENTATLLLAEATYDVEDDYEGNETGSDVSEDEPTEPTGRPMDRKLAIDIDLSLSPWSNARQYYDQKKTAAAKEQKTLQSSAKALKSTERKINADLKKGLKQEKAVMRPVRQQFWFEKFVYFISSEGYLVLGGRDAQQNEILYKRYLKKGDMFIHADLHGAASVIIKNKPGMLQSPIPPSTLSQAGTLAVATSSAWDSKAVMSAWWVRADQVSKTAPNGEYLATGNFIITGQKNYLPPAQLLLGFGVMFQISEESKARHMKHRVVEDATIPSQSSLDGVHRGTQGTIHRAGGVNEVSYAAREKPNVADALGIHQEERIEASEHESGSESRPDVSSLSKDDFGIRTSPSDDDHHDDDGDDHEIDRAEPEAEAYTDLRSNSSSIPGGRYPLQPGIDANDEAGQDSGSETTDEYLSDHESPVEGSRRASQAYVVQDQETAPSPPRLDNQATSRVRHLSAHQRRLLHQGRDPQSNGSAQSADAETRQEPMPMAGSMGDGSSSNIAGSTESASGPTTPRTKVQALPIRGKHGKRNKFKAKYVDQDDEDRALALQVLGSAAGQQKLVDDTDAKAAKELELAAQRERRRKQHVLAAERGRQSEETRKLGMQAGIETQNQGETENRCDLEAFVGTVLPGDEILNALVVCGPWDAIGARCKWRAKLQPGTTKKGKAVREILSTWTAALAGKDKRTLASGGTGERAATEEAKLGSTEVELIRGLQEPELIGIVPVGKCRVILGSGVGNNKGGGGGGGAKGKRGGKGSKKQR